MREGGGGAVWAREDMAQFSIANPWQYFFPTSPFASVSKSRKELMFGFSKYAFWTWRLDDFWFVFLFIGGFELDIENCGNL